MESKRSRGRYERSDSSSDSSCGSPGSPSSSPARAVSPAPGTSTGANVFANDGSFMEMFKKKMEEEKRKKEGQSSGVGTSSEPASEADKKSAPVTTFVRGLAVVRCHTVVPFPVQTTTIGLQLAEIHTCDIFRVAFNT